MADTVGNGLITFGVIMAVVGCLAVEDSIWNTVFGAYLGGIFAAVGYFIKKSKEINNGN